jgi:hypothetical protein
VISATSILIISFTIAGIGILGSYLQGRKTAWGWAVGFGSEVLWIVIGLVTGQWSAAIAGSAYASVAVHNFFKWRRESKTPSQSNVAQVTEESL